jgi:hypothetical protein
MMPLREPFRRQQLPKSGQRVTGLGRAQLPGAVALHLHTFSIAAPHGAGDLLRGTGRGGRRVGGHEASQRDRGVHLPSFWACPKGGDGLRGPGR